MKINLRHLRDPFISPGRIGLRKKYKKIILFLKILIFFNPKYIEISSSWEGKSIPSSQWYPDFLERKNYPPQESECFMTRYFIVKSSLVVWALHNHPRRILQFSAGKLVSAEAQDALI